MACFYSVCKEEYAAEYVLHDRVSYTADLLPFTDVVFFSDTSHHVAYVYTLPGGCGPPSLNRCSPSQAVVQQLEVQLAL